MFSRASDWRKNRKETVTQHMAKQQVLVEMLGIIHSVFTSLF